MRGPARVELDRPRAEPAGREHEPRRRVAGIVTGCPGRHRRHARAVAVERDDLGAEHEPPAGASQRRAQDLVQAHPRHRRRQRRDLEHGTAEAMLEVGPGAVRVADARAPPAARRARGPGAASASRAANSARHAGSSNRRASPSEFWSARSTSISISTDRASIPARRRLEAHSAAWKSRSDARAHHAHALACGGVAGGHRLGHERRRAQRADRRRQQDVVLEIADVAVAGQRSGLDASSGTTARPRRPRRRRAARTDDRGARPRAPRSRANGETTRSGA